MTEWILTSSVLILLMLAVRGLFKNRMKAKAVYALWFLVLVRLLCPVNFGELSFNLLSLAEEGKAQVEERLELKLEEPQEILQAKEQEAASSQKRYILPDGAIVVYPAVADRADAVYQDKMQELAPDTKAEGPVMAQEPSAELADVPEKAGFTLPEINWQKVLPVVWLAGIIGMAIVIFGVNISFGTTLGMFRKELPAMARKGRGNKELSVYLAEGISSSCLYGVVRPSIYLNKTGMGEQEKTYCVEHEYSHYLQGDMVWSLCRTVCLILHWYNPLVWVAVMLSKKDAELACDERTIERLGEEERYSYGHTLVELAAGQSRAVQMFGMATLMASDKKEVVERVKAITIKKETKILTGLLVAILVVGIGFFVFTGEARGEQENNNDKAPKTTVTETPAPEVTVEPAKKEPAETTPIPTEAAKQEEKQTTAITAVPTPMPTWIIEKTRLGSAEDIPAWEESVRIYKEKDTNSAYTEGFFSEVSLSLKDTGDECWFLAETTEDEFGWVRYGEHKDVDSRIRYIVGVTSETEYAENRAKKALEAKQVQESNINYQELRFTDHIALEYTPDNGWLVDLNGDGTKEQLYITGNRVFINGTMQLSYKLESNRSFWLLDIDTTDGMYELMDENGDLYIYNGNALCGVNGIQRIISEVSETVSEYKFSVYLGSLCEFTRVDEHTIQFEDQFFMEGSFLFHGHYTLDENHGLQLVSQIYDVTAVKPINGVSHYHYNKDRTYKVYKEPDLNGRFVSADSLNGVTVLKSDCKEWAYIETEGGLSGWLWFGEGRDLFFTLKTEDEPVYPKVLLRLYTEKDETASCTDVQFDISMYQSSRPIPVGSNWHYVELNTGVKGWFYNEQKDESIITWYLRQAGLQEGVDYSLETQTYETEPHYTGHHPH